MNALVDLVPLQRRLLEQKIARDARKAIASNTVFDPSVLTHLIPLELLRAKIRAIEVDVAVWKEELRRLELEAIGRDADTSVREIIRFVSIKYNVSRQDIISSRRSGYVIIPRQLVMYLARRTTTLSLPMIGMNMGHRDHTTILHGANKIASLMRGDKSFCARVEMLVDELSLADPVLAERGGA